ncbi:hypothetical protein IRP63_05420 [Clostridium botulinum]|uniref:Uncharacterized protein n=1 Tax=Clostridium botulinum C/D str. DC5 TaxID=1443128 RepID=A0A0A0IJ91_CLOBO|nr:MULTISPECIES: hypothetical protein [Clostridium]KGN00312.1 hypothetical protein Z955_03775 [Clostridium botulinum C/D str. DC5]KOC51317.1 hypothetical protein ADU89_13700 [Clostridium botulinum]KOC53681.1 hypothetical protein ADU90_13080 [Clostridium botulinum]MCD3234617.1 hypothetical protein [Clostridium botulinum D/C]MCD3239760.1 hypothetical protein [Clostridium botulinum D/C]
MGFFKKLKEIRNNANKLNNRGIELGATDSITLIHDEGLPIAVKTLCKIFLCSDKLVICTLGAEFNIKLHQINNSEIISTNGIKDKSGRFIENSQIKKGEKTVQTFHFVINYTNSNNEISNVVLNSGYDFLTSNKFSEKLNSLLTNKNTIIDL